MSISRKRERAILHVSKSNISINGQSLQRAIAARESSTVVLCNNIIIGFANFYQTEINQSCSIGNVVINSRYRRKGAAKYLIGVMEHIAIEKYNATEIHISCFNQNVAGLLLYSKLGYKPYEIEKRLDTESRPIALIKMNKHIGTI